jgi:hypothetical protein
VNSSVERSRSWFRSGTMWIAILICVVGIVTRIPFRSQILHHWDSVNFALAINHFDVRLHQPHPPGTFVIYIMLGRLFDLVVHDPNASLVWLSVVLSGLGAVALFLLGTEWFGREVGLTTALLAIVSPLVWFHGEVALSYMLEFLWVPILVYFVYKMQTRSWWALLASALMIGMAGGIRPNTPVFLFPLWILGIVVHKYPLKKILVALLVMGVGVLIWAIPMLVMSGGLMEYIELMRWWQNQHTEESASLAGVAGNTARFVAYAVYNLGLGLVPLVIASIRIGCTHPHLPGIVRSLKKDWRTQALAGWIAPAAGYFTIIHLMQPGHTFTIQPALLLLAGLAIVSLARMKGVWHRNVWIAVTVVVVVVNALFFVVGPTYLFGDTRLLFTTPTWNTIHDYDVYVTERLDAIRHSFPPQETAILANGRNFRLPDYYLPDYQLTSLSYQVNASSVMLAEPIHTLVFFDDSMLSELPAGVAVQAVPLPDGESLHYITWDERHVVVVGQGTLEIREES